MISKVEANDEQTCSKWLANRCLRSKGNSRNFAVSEGDGCART